MTTHLLQLGHERIGFIVGNPNQAASSLRRKGFECAIKESGLKLHPDLVVQGDFTYRSGLTAAEALLSRQPRPTAIFASNDDMAAAAIAVAHRHHLDVPNDVSVCGFDDTAMATTIWPELTTIRQPVAAMSGQATRLLVDAVRSGTDVGTPRKIRHTQLKFELIRRFSDSPPSNKS